MYDHLFLPLKVGMTELPNRICLLAHRTNFGKGGRLTDRHIAYYRRRAEGGCGLIIVGELTIHPDDRPWETLIDTRHPEIGASFRRLTGAIHEFDTRVFAQLKHHGFQSNGSITRKAIWGPSATSDIVFGEVCKPMEPEDFAELTEAFVESAIRAKEGGFDGVEIDMGPESLLRQFLSPICNHRGDEYGGSLENRMRLPLQVVTEVRKAVGKDFTIGVCLCVDEKFPGGISPQESVVMAQVLERTRHIDFINVAVGTYYNLHMIMPSLHVPFGFTIESAEVIKKNARLPVFASYQIEFPDMAEDVIKAGRADVVGFVRALISDPDMARKAREGRVADIRRCVKDNKGCIGRINQSKPLGCIQNPEIGHESLTGARPPAPATKKKNVMVIGAGPAGLEAARVASERGHDVVVYEREAGVGGQINLIGKRPGRESMPGVIRYLEHMIDMLGVPVHTGITVTPELVAEKNPDVVIVATGSRPEPAPFPGKYGPPSVLTGMDVIRGTHPVGNKVLFIDEDGGHHAMATVELLVNQGKQVDLLTSDLFIGIELAPRGELYLGRQRLLQKGVRFTTDVEITEIKGNKVRARNIYTNESIQLNDYDTIVHDVGSVADDALYKQIKGQVKAIYRIGDCVAPRGIDMAIIEGRKVGELL